MIAQRISMIPPPSTRPLRVMAGVFALSGICLLTIATPGCRPPALDPQEYGEVLTELPYVPGVEKPYVLPELEESSDKAKDSPPQVEK
jgi:hypothetical protein